MNSISEMTINSIILKLTNNHHEGEEIDVLSPVHLSGLTLLLKFFQACACAILPVKGVSVTGGRDKFLTTVRSTKSLSSLPASSFFGNSLNPSLFTSLKRNVRILLKGKKMEKSRNSS